MQNLGKSKTIRTINIVLPNPFFALCVRNNEKLLKQYVSM